MSMHRLRLQPLAFGRGRTFVMESQVAPAPALSDDLKLFLLTYLAGFVIVSIFLV